MADGLGELLESGALDQPGAPMHRGDLPLAPPRPPWWSGMFSHKPIRGRVEGIDKPIPRSLEDRAYDYFPDWVREGAKKSFGAIPPEGWVMNERRLRDMHALGKTDEQIAARLGISPKTVYAKRMQLGLPTIGYTPGIYGAARRHTGKRED